MSETRVTTTDGKVEFGFSDEEVTVTIVGTSRPVVIPWNEWEFIARVYGRRRAKQGHAKEHCEWCDETTQTEAAWNDEWESSGVRCSKCGAWRREQMSSGDDQVLRLAQEMTPEDVAQLRRKWVKFRAQQQARNEP
jgi:hypothetical protein